MKLSIRSTMYLDHVHPPLSPSSFLHPSYTYHVFLPTSRNFVSFLQHTKLSQWYPYAHMQEAIHWIRGNSQWLTSFQRKAIPLPQQLPTAISSSARGGTSKGPTLRFQTLFDFWRLYVGIIFYITILSYPMLTHSHSYGCCELMSFTAKSFLEASLSGLLPIFWLLHFQSIPIGLSCSSKLDGKTLLKTLHALVVEH